jgi:heparan-alpha-glucosaminide N-acetyltransferase
MNQTLPTPALNYATPSTFDAPPPPLPPQKRLVSLDAYRGLVMIMMASAGLGLSTLAAQSFPNHPVWHNLGYHTDHAPWTGCTLWDLIQPCFMFMVGASIPFSIAARQAKGHGRTRMSFHALWRALAFSLLGVFLASNWSKHTNWLFTNVLAQIGLGYFFLFLLAWLKPTWQFVAAIAILVFYWLAFVLYPAPLADFDFAKVGGANWPYRLHGFAAHWDFNTNLAAHFDRWFLNLFPRQEDFIGERGGYTTLNFIPSLATMIFGLLAGGLLRTNLSAGKKILILLAAAAIGLATGWLLDITGICPMVKRIWTPSFALFSAGWALAALAFFYLIVDVMRLRFWTFPLVIVGMNSIAFYMMFQITKGYIRESIQRHFGQDIFEQPLGKTYVPLVQSATLLLALWLIALWMHRRRIYLKI